MLHWLVSSIRVKLCSRYNCARYFYNYTCTVRLLYMYQVFVLEHLLYYVLLFYLFTILFHFRIFPACDPNCNSVCNTNGPGKCDQSCNSFYTLTTTYTCTGTVIANIFLGSSCLIQLISVDSSCLYILRNLVVTNIIDRPTFYWMVIF